MPSQTRADCMFSSYLSGHFCILHPPPYSAKTCMFMSPGDSKLHLGESVRVNVWTGDLAMVCSHQQTSATL